MTPATRGALIRISDLLSDDEVARGETIIK
jgi:hypothetical protein